MSANNATTPKARVSRPLRRKTPKKIRASIVMNWILRKTLVVWLDHRYRLHAENREIFRKVRPPFLLLPNHSCVWDPFMVNGLVPYPVHYVVSDASFRSRLVSFGLSLVGSIPKTKAMSDMDTIKNIMRVKDRGGVVGIFPEGQSTWDGHTLPPVQSTAKLAKLLRIPVVTAEVCGAYFSKPRWSKKSRRGRVTVRFALAFTAEQLRKATLEEIDARITAGIDHDDSEYNREAGIVFIGKDRAEYLERALFVCPRCSAIASLRSEGHRLGCEACGHSVTLTTRGLFASDDGELRFDTVRKWNLWQVEEFTRQLLAYLADPPDTPFLREEAVKVQKGYKSRPLAPFHDGSLELHPDRIVLHTESGGREEFPLAGIRGANVQNNEHWEFYSGPDLFRVTISDPRGCTYKWNLALKLIDGADKNRSSQ